MKHRSSRSGSSKSNREQQILSLSAVIAGCVDDWGLNCVPTSASVPLAFLMCVCVKTKIVRREAWRLFLCVTMWSMSWGLEAWGWGREGVSWGSMCVLFLKRNNTCVVCEQFVWCVAVYRECYLLSLIIIFFSFF